MSDISLNFSAFDYALIALILCGPGALLGLLIGAAGWNEHRVLGAVLGALEGFLVSAGYFHVYLESSLSRSDGAAAAVVKALVVAWPGIAIGAIAAACLWRHHRLLGSVAGAAAGFVLWLYGWWLVA